MIHAFVDLDSTLIYAHEIPGPRGYATKLRPGAKAFLRTLRKLADRIELLTAGNMEHASLTLKERRIGEFFDAVWAKDNPPPAQSDIQAFRVLFDDLSKADAGDFTWKQRLLHPFIHIQVGTYLGRNDPYPTLKDALLQFQTLLEVCRAAGQASPC